MLVLLTNSYLGLVRSLQRSPRYQEGCSGSVRYEDLQAEALVTTKRIYSPPEDTLGSGDP